MNELDQMRPHDSAFLFQAVLQIVTEHKGVKFRESKTSCPRIGHTPAIEH
jgi:hypothetical protein